MKALRLALRMAYAMDLMLAENLGKEMALL